YVVFLALLLTLGLGHWLMRDLHLGGTAIVIAVALAAFLLWRDYVGLKKFGDAYKRATQFDRWRTRTLVAEVEAEGEVVTRRTNYGRWVLLIAILVLLFLPYQYDASGSFSIFPA